MRTSYKVDNNIIFFVTEDWYFCSHRLPIARAAQRAGYKVIIVTRERKHGATIRKEGFKLVPLEIRRSGMNPLADFFVLLKLVRIFRKYRPAIVHNVALKPVLYGTLAARLVRIPVIVNALGGMGFLFNSSQGGARILRQGVIAVFRVLLHRKRLAVIIQNHVDQDFFLKVVRLSGETVTLIRGSGVDVQHFIPTPEPEGVVRVTMVSRMLWDKGGGELVAAARLLKDRGTGCKLTLVGEPDVENPKSISEQQLEAWASEGIIEWWGRRNDIAAVWAKSHIAVLPTYYGEGLPKSLLEPAACSRPIITTDIPGCRELVKDGVNGLLVPPKDVEALADAIKKLVDDAEKRKQMGKEGRRIVLESFSEEIVVDQTMALYHKLTVSNDR